MFLGKINEKKQKEILTLYLQESILPSEIILTKKFDQKKKHLNHLKMNIYQCYLKKE